MEFQVRTLEEGHLDAATSVLVRAFANDPILTRLLRSADDDAGHRAFFRSLIRDHLGNHHAFGAWADADLVGVALWTAPPDRTRIASLEQSVDSQLLDRLYPQGMIDVTTTFERLALLHPRAPHWYLAFIGVEPSRQGHGVGSRLLEPTLRRADRAGLSCYLETPAAASLPFYRRHGFELISEVRPFPGLALPVWTMIRAPRSVSR